MFPLNVKSGGSLDRCEKERSGGSWLEIVEVEPCWGETKSRRGRRRRRRRMGRLIREGESVTSFLTLLSVSKMYDAAIKSKSLLTDGLDWKSGFYLISLILNFHINKMFLNYT